MSLFIDIVQRIPSIIAPSCQHYTIFYHHFCCLSHHGVFLLPVLCFCSKQNSAPCGDIPSSPPGFGYTYPPATKPGRDSIGFYEPGSIQFAQKNGSPINKQNVHRTNRNLEKNTFCNDLKTCFFTPGLDESLGTSLSSHLQYRKTRHQTLRTSESEFFTFLIHGMGGFYNVL